MPHPTRVALLGAGHIGQTIARLLAGSGDYQVTLIDRSAAALGRVRGAGITPLLADTDNGPALLAALRSGATGGGHQVVVNALPYHLAVASASVARQAGCHYFDLTEDVAATRAIQALADGARTAFMPQCGLAPGFIGIVAHHLAQRFETLHDVKMRVGALPAFPTNALKYNLTWSVDGLINEYCHPCEAIRDGRNIEVLPLEGLEHFSLDGTEYEAFNTSGGLGTLCETPGRPGAHAGLQKRALPRPPGADEDAAGRPAIEGRARDAEEHLAQKRARHHAGRGAGVRHRQRPARRATAAGGVCPQDLCRPQ